MSSCIHKQTLQIKTDVERDSQCLSSILKQTKERLQSFNLGLKALLADAGYCSGENYALLEREGIEAFIPIHGTYKGEPEGFIYDREGDCWIWPNGKKATFSRVKLSPQYIKQRQYFTRRSD